MRKFTVRQAYVDAVWLAEVGYPTGAVMPLSFQQLCRRWGDWTRRDFLALRLHEPLIFSTLVHLRIAGGTDKGGAFAKALA